MSSFLTRQHAVIFNESSTFTCSLIPIAPHNYVHKYIHTSIIRKIRYLECLHAESPVFLVRGTPRTWEKLAVNQATYTRIRVGDNSADWPRASRNSGKNMSGIWENYQTNMASVTARLAEFLRQPSGRSSSFKGTCVCVRACLSIHPFIRNYHVTISQYIHQWQPGPKICFSRERWNFSEKKIIHLTLQLLLRLSRAWWQLLLDSREIED